MKLANCLHAVVRRLIPLAQRLRASPGHFFDACWEFSRRYFFTVALFALLSAKVLHLYAHIYSLPPPKFLLWGITFFFQDVCVLILIRIFTQRIPWRPVAMASALLVIPFSLMMSGMASANASFYVVTGAEIHWRQAKTFHRDAAAIRTLLTGLTGFLIVEGLLLTVAWFTANQVHRGAGGVLKVLAWPFRRLGGLIRNLIYRIRGRQPPVSLPDPQVYEQIAVDDYRDDKSDDEEDSLPMMESTNMGPTQKKDSLLKRAGVLVPFTILMFLRAIRPWDPAFWFLSGALPFTPFTDGSHRPSPVDTYGMPGDYRWLEGHSSLSETPVWDWMPEKAYPGFEDWDRTERPEFHYNPKEDPLHISNLDNPVLEPIRKALNGEKGAKVKHVFLLKLESTRGDLFPIRKDSFMWDRIAESYKDKKLPQEVKSRIANLTRTAEFLTGFSTGFHHNDTLHHGKKTYGGVAASNAFTTGTYTLKSVTGTVCGITPLVADFNREYEYHIYQPCLPHIFNALSHQDDITNKTDDFRTWPWHSKWMQTVTDSYDNQDKLTPVLGYHDILTKERIEDKNAKHYPPEGKEVNYYGYADTNLREYIRDAIDEAEGNNTRLFLTHLTGTTHHPWGLPDDDLFQEIISSSWTGSNGDLNRYLNTIHFVDGWLQEVLDILQEKGIADETLLVMMGDHGLSLPNDGGATPYDNPHLGSFHIPIVFSHPKLPQVEIKTPVISQQIVPTILDLLIESSSLGPNGTHAAKDIRSLYEGQSMIRELIPEDKEDKKKQDWQFTVMNTGGSWLALRSAARPKYRLVIPLIDDLEWRFTDLEKDPNEKKPYKDFNLVDLAEKLDKEYGEDVVEWLRDAAHVAQWWVVDNWHRYRYHPKPPKHKG
ncbi:sulfatase domain protein [Aspergillus steynii IBT 23096]|uniref:Sulfatase domain protein n=1 Tax=Aspergillus steynii IBT 23096 TaxID=1392250 RepID=A0A2I2GER7_9EURO|nr:sulfatase domain protein [Aspergillus steynii IBT 23096]PLB51327.1 sulfatase domain protein [Aspergillus steynii IBT 23096]